MYFFPLPHQQGSFRPSLGISPGVRFPSNLLKIPMLSPESFIMKGLDRVARIRAFLRAVNKKTQSHSKGE